MNRLRILREQRGITQQELADYCGVSTSYISRLETGKRKIPSTFLPLFERKLQLESVNELFQTPEEI